VQPTTPHCPFMNDSFQRNQ